LSVRAFLQRLFGRRTPASAPENPFADGDAAPGSDDDFSWMYPPATLTDPAPWDRYWHAQFDNGVAGFVHMFCDDGSLVDVMRANGLRTVLCVGSGISVEPHALAWAGLDVTALDLSPFAMETAKAAAPPDDFLMGLVGGRSAGLNGRVEFVVGDLCDAACCPGPYDVVIDRKTLQLYPDQQRPAAMKAVASRLAPRGIFFSQCHDGGWRPPSPPRNATQEWFVNEGWTIWRDGGPLAGRVAWPFTTTG
jgi:hypothetical protein